MSQSFNYSFTERRGIFLSTMLILPFSKTISKCETDSHTRATGSDLDLHSFWKCGFDWIFKSFLAAGLAVHFWEWILDFFQPMLESHEVV